MGNSLSQPIFSPSSSNTLYQTTYLAENTGGTLASTTSLGSPLKESNLQKMSDSVSAKDGSETYITGADTGSSDGAVLTEANGDGIPLNRYWSKENSHEYNVGNIGRCLTELKKLQALYEQNATNLSEENAHRFSAEEIKDMYSEQMVLTKEISHRQQWLSGRFTEGEKLIFGAAFVAAGVVGAIEDIPDTIGRIAFDAIGGVSNLIGAAFGLSMEDNNITKDAYSFRDSLKGNRFENMIWGLLKDAYGDRMTEEDRQIGESIILTTKILTSFAMGSAAGGLTASIKVGGYSYTAKKLLDVVGNLGTANHIYDVVNDEKATIIEKIKSTLMEGISAAAGKYLETVSRSI